MITGEHFYNLLCYIMFFNVTICYVTLRSFTSFYIIVWYGMVRFLILKYVTTDHINLETKNSKDSNYLFR